MIEFRADTAHAHGASEMTDILEAVVPAKILEIAIAREVSDSVQQQRLPMNATSIAPSLPFPEEPEHNGAHRNNGLL